MRTLVTGGAGFIGSHLVSRAPRARRRRRRPRQPRGAGTRRDEAGICRRTSSCIVGDVGDPALVDRRSRQASTASSISPPSSASGSRCTRSRATSRMNTMATATFLERWSSRTARPSAARRRLVDVDLRRGRSTSATSTARRAGAAARGAARGARVGVPVPDVRRASCARSRTSEDKPLIPTSVYAITKRDHEELCLVVGAAYGIPTVALRFFNVYGPGQALSNPYTGVAAIFASRLLNGRPPVIFEDGRAVARLHPRRPTSSTGIVLALESERAPSASADQSRHGPTGDDRRRCRRSRAASESRSSPTHRRSTAPATSGTATRTPTLARELLGFRAP